jgi:thymidine kinase
MNSKLDLIIGPMFSGKTTKLIYNIQQLQRDNNKIIVINTENYS